MPDANLLFSNTFDGTGYPTFDPWPNFSVVTGNPSLSSQPVVDGYGHGISSRHHRVRWRMRETRYPGRSGYQVDLWAKWKNAGFSSRQVGLIVRFKDFNNFIVARLKSNGTSSPTLSLYQVINGVEKQLGSSYSGTPISATNLNNGVRFRVRVEDLTDGSGWTSVKVYTDPLGASDKGDLRIDWEGAITQLRGPYTVGIEMGQFVQGSEIQVDDLEVYDFADEWTSATPPAAGSGWQVELDGQLYDIDDSTGALGDLDPPIVLLGCGQSLGLSSGQEARFRVLGKFHEGLLRPGQPTKVYHDGDIRFNGEMVNGRLTASPEETQEWTAKDFVWASTRVLLEEDDCTGTHFFNVYDTESDDYNADRQNMTIGDIIQFLFDRYLTNLRFHGAAPASGLPYTLSQLNLLDAVVPDIAVSGNFLGAISTLLSYMPNFQVWGNPEDKTWEFRDVTNMTGQNISLTGEWATLSIEPDPERAITAITWRGSKKESADDVSLTFADRAWTDAQANNYSTDKKSKSNITLKIVAAGNSAGLGGPSTSLVYVDVLAGDLQEDDWKGAVATVTGDAYPRFVISNTSTRIWMGSPLWGGGTPPSPGETITMSLVHPDAIPALSAAGVGRAFFLPPAYLCPAYAPYGLGFKNKGWCGTATVSGTGESGEGYEERYKFKTHFLNAEQSSAFGACGVVMLSDRPKPPIGLVNFLPEAGGSPPNDYCTSYTAEQMTITVNLAATEECAPKFRVPAEGYYGTAYSEDETNWEGGGEPEGLDWGVRREAVIDDPDFIDQTIQEPGLTKAAEAILKLYSSKPYLWEVELASPWQGALPDAAAAATSTYAGMTKRITLSSGKRTTGYEAASDLPVYSVWWDVPENKTILQAGTASGWIGGDFGSITKVFNERTAALRQAKMLKELEDFRNRMLSKAADLIGGSSEAATPGCNIYVTDYNSRKVTNINVKMEDEQEQLNHLAIGNLASESLFSGVEDYYPGSQIGSPGYDGAEAQQVRDGPVLQSHANHRIPFMGPTGDTNSDRGKYGGLIGSEDEDAGNSPAVIYRRGGLAFRKTPNLNGTSGGGVGIQYSVLDSSGTPTTWNTYNSPLDLPNGVAPLSMLNHGSTQHQLLERSRTLAFNLGVVENALGKLQSPGDVSAEYPDGAPADLASSLRAQGFLHYFEPVASSFSDPGGMVWHGPFTENGADAQKYWRIMTPEMLMVEVQSNPGAGENGGDWAWVDNGDGSYNYMSAGYCVHKQSHLKDLDEATTTPGTTSNATTSNQWGADEGLTLNSGGTGAPSTGTSILTMPDGVVGQPMFWFIVQEAFGAGLAPGLTMDFQMEYQYRASAWSGAAGGPSGTLTTDGADTAVGYYAGPGGAVPPGLRAVTGAVTYTPGTGTAPANAPAGLLGWGAEVAVVEGGFLVRKKDSLTAADVATNTAPWWHDVPTISDALVLDIFKNVSEAAGISDEVGVELNPPVAEDELVGISELVTLTIIQVDEDATIADSTITELNP